MHVDVWTYDEPQDYAMQARTHGLLVVDLGFAGIESGLDVEVVRWPHGTWWDADADELVTADGRRIPPGTVLTLGGGHVDNERTGPPSTHGTDTVFEMGANTVRVG